MKHKKTLRRGLSILLSVLLCLTLVPATALAEGTETSVAINEENFPDETFRAYVSQFFDTDKNGALSTKEIENVTRINCPKSSIASLKGIEYFTALTELSCIENQLTSLNISNNTALKELLCDENQLTALDVSSNKALTTLSCWGNQLTSLDVSNNTALKALLCDENQLTALDVSSNKALTTLSCTYNVYAIELSKERTFDLSTLPGNFDVNKASDWTNGTVSKNTLTVDEGVNTVTYTYDCGNNKTATFTLDATPKYTVTFNANGGGGSMADVTGVSGSYKLPACGFTAPSDKQFKGWATSASGEVIDDTTITVTANTTLYAIWEDVEDSAHSMPGYHAILTEGFEDAAWPTGWSVEDKDGDGYNWEIEEVGIGNHFCHHGSRKANSASYEDNSALTPDNWLYMPEITIGSGYKLTFCLIAQDQNSLGDKLGVYISTDGGESYTQIGEDYEAGEDWKEYTVDLSAYAGKEAIIAFVHHNSEDIFQLILDCVYIWAPDDSAETYTVSFNANGGSGEMADVTEVSGSYTLPACEFTAPEGKQFKGWATSENGEVLNDTTITVNENTTLYAIWEEIPAATEYNITVTDGKATVGEGTEISQAAEGTTVTLTANAAPADQVFDKWVVESGSITLADANSATTTFNMPAGAVSVKATYKDKTISGGGYIPTVQKPTIDAGEGVKVTLSADGKTATITVDNGYEIADVVLNGVSQGKTTEVKGLKTGDKLVVTAEKQTTTPTKEEIQATLDSQKLVARSKIVTLKNGKKAVKIEWYNENGETMDFDGVEIYRSTKRYSGYGKTPFFETDRETYWNTAIKSGTTYYYKVRGYIELNGERYYTGWSKKAIRTVK